MDPKIPARSDITVLPADPPGEQRLTFPVYEREGFPIYDATTLQPIPATETLEAGRKVVFSDAGDELGAEVIRDDSGWYIKVGFSLYFLKPCDDERACWVCWGSANTRGLEKLSVTR